MKYLILILCVLMLCSCVKNSDADIASENLSNMADDFELNRRVVFYNVMTDKYILLVEGRCSIEKNVSKNQLAVTIKTGHKSYKKHYLGVCENMTYFSEQLESANVSVYRYKVIFKPVSIIPDIDID